MKLFSKSLIALSLVLALNVQAETRQVGEIQWEASTPSNIITDNVANNMSQLVFMRLKDGMSPDSNANLAIDSSYHVSLGPGHVTKVQVCSGDHIISSQVTANKSNDLMINANSLITEAENTYFFNVQVSEKGNTEVFALSPTVMVDDQNLHDYLTTLPSQSHQVSRVIVDCPPAPVYVPTPEVEVVPEVELFVPYRLDVLFEFDKAIIQPVYNARIQKLAEYFEAHPDTIATIEGHTDSTGTDAYNQKLSEQRATAVKQKLISQYNVDPNRLTSVGYGESKPTASNKTKQGRQQNRRVVAVVSPK